MADESGDPRLNEIIAAYLKTVDAGLPPGRAALLARHPELAAELAAFFADHDAIAPLPGTPPATADVHTIGLEEASAGPSPGARVGYFGDYELLGELGRGGMGVVYKARQVSLNRVVALKMILTGQLAHEEDVRRFHAEAEAAAKLDHPGIVPVFEVGQYEGHHYFSMAFVEGESLARKLAEGLPPPREAAELIRKVAEAVAFAHVEGVIHRDLKPANILIAKHSQPRLTDFGLAKRVEGDCGLTATGQILGTPSYMPPEQASGRRGDVGPHSDLYSLGAVLYCLLTGRPPFQAATPLDTILQVLEREPVPPRQLNAAVPRDLETICLKCLQKEPSRRYPSADALAEDLDRFLNGEPIRARPVGRAERAWRWCRRNPLVAGLSAACVLALVLGMAGVSWKWLEAETARREASAAADRNQRLLADNYLDRGQAFCEEGDITRGLLWLAHGLATAPPSAPDLQRVIRANLGAWVRSAAPLRAVHTHSEPVVAVAFSHDGQTMLKATARGGIESAEGIARMYDVASGQPIGAAIPISPRSWVSHGARPLVSLSPDGKMIATGEPMTGIQLRDAATGELRGTVKPGELQEMAFSSDGTMLLTVAFGDDGESVCLWDITSQKPIREVKVNSSVFRAALSPDGKTLAIGHNGSTVLWDVATGQPIDPPLTYDSFARAMCFSFDSKTLVTAYDGGTVLLWDVATGKPRGAPLTHLYGAGQGATIHAVAVSPDGQTILTGSNTIRLWDAATGTPLGLPRPHRLGFDVIAVAFRPDGRTFLSASRDRTVRVWDMPLRPPADIVLSHKVPVAVAFSPDGLLIGTGGSGVHEGQKTSEARLWERATGKLLTKLLVNQEPVSQVAFSPDGKTFATLSISWESNPRIAWAVHFWDVATGQAVGRPLRQEMTLVPGQAGGILAMGFGPDGKTLAVTGADNMVRQWDLATGQPIGEPHRSDTDESGSDDTRCVVSPDRKRKLTFPLMVPGWDYTARVTGPGPSDAGQVQHQDMVAAGAFSPDSTRILTGSYDRTARLWDAATLKPIGPVIKHAEAVGTLAFSPDGRAFLTGSPDGMVRLGRMMPGVEGPAERIVLWVQVLTGSELRGPQVHVLDGEEWLSRAQRLDQTGGPPLP